MKKEELAALMNGREYTKEITRAEADIAAASGLVAIFGYSDDNVELRGAIREEIGAWGSTTLYLHKDGVLEDPRNIDCEKCAAQARKDQKKCVPIAVRWDVGEYSWIIEPTIAGAINVAPFEIVEDGKPFCRGIVIDVADLPKL